MAKTIADLKQDTSNPRKHNARNLQVIVDSLQDVGFARSIVIDENDTILAGNGVTEAAALAGIDKVVEVEADGNTIIAVRRRGLTDEQKQRLKYFDNRSGELAEWNTEQLLADIGAGLDLSALFRDDEMDALLADLQPKPEVNDAGPQVDRADELRQKWGVNSGDLWQLGEHRLICGDCTDAEVVERVMGGERAEMVWTDPPYGVAVGDKNKFLNSIARSNRIEENLENDTLDEPELMKMLCAAFDNAMAVCLAGGAWYVAAPARPLHVLFGQALKDRDIWRQTIQWVKNNATFSPMGVDYHWQAEPIFYGWQAGAGHRYYGGRQQTTVWEIDRPMRSPEHPTMKPVELVARAVENSSLHGQIVYDPFLGSGTTLIACNQLGRKCRAVEISPGYVAVALDRWATATGKTPVLVTG